MGQREILLLISKLLTDLKIPYLLTGSFASSYFGFPRATHDIDFVIEVSFKDFSRLEKTLKKLEDEFIIDLAYVKENIGNETHFDIYHAESGIKVDFWPIKKSEFNTSRLRRKREEIIFGEKIWVISPEDLILTKLLWCREVRSEKHMRDCAGIIKIQGDKLDQKYLSNWAKKLGIGDLYKEATNMDY